MEWRGKAQYVLRVAKQKEEAAAKARLLRKHLDISRPEATESRERHPHNTEICLDNKLLQRGKRSQSSLPSNSRRERSGQG